MSNTQRPSIQRKHTRKTDANRTAALDAGMVVTVDGEKYEVRVGDVTPAIAREVRRNFGMGVQSLLREMARDPDLDVLAGFMWIARLIRGEQVDLEEVEENLDYSALTDEDFSAAIAEPESEGDLPPEG